MSLRRQNVVLNNLVEPYLFNFIIKMIRLSGSRDFFCLPHYLPIHTHTHRIKNPKMKYAILYRKCPNYFY